MIPTYLTPLPVTGTITTIPSGTQDINIVSPNPLPVEISILTGIWKYYSGIAGTVIIGGTERVIGIAAYSSIAGTVVINGGSTIVIPAGVSVGIEPNGILIGPTIIFTGTDTYLIEVVY